MAADAEPAQDRQPKARIFISYSRKDMAFADRLEAGLKARGFEPLIDRTEIYALEDWWQRIQALIGKADTIVFVLSPDAVASDTCTKEVAFAASLSKRFAPIVCTPVQDNAVPEALRRLNFIFFDNPARFEASADALADALQTDIGWIRQHTEYGEAERRWSAAGRPGGLLLHSPTLDLAEYWIASRPRGAPEPTEEIRAFVAASRHGARAAQRLRRFVQASMFTLLIGIILGLVGWINQSYIAEQWRWYSTERPFLAANMWPYVLKPAAEQALKPGDSFTECTPDQLMDYCPEMIVVPAGSFTMGSPAPEQDRTDKPQHLVTIAKPFAVSTYELNFNEWDTCVSYGDCPQGVADDSFGRGRQPVINVTWDDAQRYVAWLSNMTGKTYRLLSEAEYEYATRARTTTTYPWGDDIGKNNANCAHCGSQWDNSQTAPVGSFAANEFGLYDMVGNVWEWVEDCNHNNYDGAPTDGSAWIEGGDCKIHLVRGGSWGDPPGYLGFAVRGRGATGGRADDRGFRVGRTLLTP
jgi:formylglycine-generating enzyme required for sulfatase activity